ncbi:hypothetical protein WN943_007486 [Citrus x changshan-huyou]
MSLRRLRVVRDRLITRLLWNRLIAGDKNEGLCSFQAQAIRSRSEGLCYGLNALQSVPLYLRIPFRGRCSFRAGGEGQVRLWLSRVVQVGKAIVDRRRDGRTYRSAQAREATSLGSTRSLWSFLEKEPEDMQQQREAFVSIENPT